MAAAVNTSTHTDFNPKNPQCKEADVFVRVQLPNDNTTVIVFKNDMTMWEVLNNICVKKELMPSQHKMKVLYADGKEEQVAPEDVLSKYHNLERVVVSKINRPPRRPSVVTAKLTAIRVASVEFPKVLTDSNDAAQQKGGHFAKIQGEYSATGRKTKSMKSLSMMIFKRSSAEVSGFDSSGFESPGSLSPNSEDARSLNSVSGISASVVEENEETGGGHPSIDKARSHDAIVRNDSIISTETTTNHPAFSASMRTFSVSSIPHSTTGTNIAGDNPDMVKASSMSSFADGATPLSAKMADGALSLKGSKPSIAETASVKKESSIESITSLPPSIYFNDNGTPGSTPLERMLRRRAASNPTPKVIGSPLRRKTYNNRPRSNTDGLLHEALNSLADTDQSPESPNSGIFKIELPTPERTVISIRVPFDQRMDDVVDFVCESNNLAPQTHTLKYGAKLDQDVEMERTSGFYLEELKIFDLACVAGERFYKTRCLSEDGKDVMLLQMVQGRFQVMAGTAEKLIERLTDEEEKDAAFLDTILLTFRSFMKPEEFLQYLVERFNCVAPENPTPEELAYYEKMKVPVQKGVFNAIAWWVEHHWHDFGVSQELRSYMEEFVEEMQYSSFEKEWLRSLIKQESEKYEEMFSYYRAVERRGKMMESMFLELSPEELGQQLCLHDFKLFRNIHPIEYLNQIWKKKTDPNDADADNGPGSGGCPCLDFFSERFDKESYWAATEIVGQKDLKKRVSVLKKFILTAKFSLDNKNFFTTFALVFGLNLTPVSRLKKTWEALDIKVRAIFAEVEKVCDPSRNFKNYKDSINTAKPPIVPFLPIYLKDLTFINDGNASTVQGMINFEKLRMMGKRVKDITSLAGCGTGKEFSFEANPAAQNYLAKPPVEKSMTKLKEMSLECEK